ncbi:MAG: hypothetical protein KDD34_02125 [Bdellovibrionales bacterium]|nr:hypothetical protein [Bdellovibrionales bacterium]
MKLSILLTAIIATFTLAAGASEENKSKDVAIGVNDVYVPGGFDSESDVFVVVSGVFPNSCYSWKEANVSKDKDNAEITNVQTMASVSQGMCLMVLVPYQKEVQLGVLGSGNHTVRFLSGDGTYLEKTIAIE